MHHLIQHHFFAHGSPVGQKNDQDHLPTTSSLPKHWKEEMNVKTRCCAELVSGKNIGLQCSQKTVSVKGFCNVHKKKRHWTYKPTIKEQRWMGIDVKEQSEPAEKNEKERPRCCAQLVSGKNIGQQCKLTAVKYGFCNIHKRKQRSDYVLKDLELRWREQSSQFNVFLHRNCQNLVKKIEIENSTERCPICIQETNSGIETVCGHFYCEDCLKQWVSTVPTCPACRHVL